MTVRFRQATEGDLADVVALLLDDPLGAQRERRDLTRYQEAFAAMASEPSNQLLVGELDGRIIAVYQLTFISGLSHNGCRRAQVESVRVASDLRGQRIGTQMMADAEERALAAGCGMMQLTTHATRNRAREFYDGLEFEPTHIGYKKRLG